MVLREVDSGLWGTGGGASGVGRLADSAALGSQEGWAGLVPRPELLNWGRMFREPCPAPREGARRGENLPPTSFPPALRGDFLRPTCWPLEESESERRKSGFQS